MAHEKLNLVRIQDHEGSHLAWQTPSQARAQRRENWSRWCSDTSLAMVAAVAVVWKWARAKPQAAAPSALPGAASANQISPYLRMRLDTHV